MLFKVDLIQLNILFIIKILKLFHLLVEIKQVNIFIKLLEKLEKEHNVIWELKIIVLLCQIVINKMLLMLLLMLHSVPVDKDVWLLLQLFLLEILNNGFMILLKKLKASKLVLVINKVLIYLQSVIQNLKKELLNLLVLLKNKVPKSFLMEVNMFILNIHKETLLPQQSLIM